MGFGRWRGHLEQHCPHVNLDSIEWKSNANVATIPYGLLIRVYKYGADQVYRSPRDDGCDWRRAEQAMEEQPAAAPTRSRRRTDDFGGALSAAGRCAQAIGHLKAPLPADDSRVRVRVVSVVPVAVAEPAPHPDRLRCKGLGTVVCSVLHGAW